MNNKRPSISVIIPVLNEEKHIAQVLNHVSKNNGTDQIIEILVVDGGSTDNTIPIAQEYGATVLASPCGRAQQMNHGAKIAKGDVLYFLHGDTIPPKNFDTALLKAYEAGNYAGCFQLRFSGRSRFLNFFAWFTKYNFLICRGGDQSLFISKKLFEQIGGFHEAYTIYEDVEIIKRIYKVSEFAILAPKIYTSPRRYLKRGMIALQWHFAVIHCKHFLGAGPKELYRYYEHHIGPGHSSPS